MRTNKKITLLASILTASTLMAMPLIAVVNNVSSNTSVVTGDEDNQITSEQVNDEIIVEDVEASNINNNVESDSENNNLVMNSEQVESTANMIITSEQCFVQGIKATTWMGVTSGGFVNFEINDVGLTATVKSTTNKNVGANGLRFPSSITYNAAEYDVIAIDNDAFKECSKLIGNLTIPGSMTSIGQSAFYRCTGLRGNLIIGDGVETIENYAFEWCANLIGNLTIPESVTSIGDEAFYGWIRLANVIIGSGVVSIGSFAFGGCSLSTIDLTTNTNFIRATNLGNNCTVILPANSLGSFENNSTAIGSLAFGQLEIPTNVTSIGGTAFAYCSGLIGTLTIPASVTSIGSSAFLGCSKLADLDLSNATGLVIIDNSAFENCIGLTGTLTIPSSVTSIGDYAFSDCSELTGTLTIPKNITIIGEGAFKNCSGLTGLNLEKADALTEIHSQAFYNCSGLTGTLTIPASVTYIGAAAFVNVGSKEFNFLSKTPPETLENGIFGTNDSTITIYVPKGEKAAWENTTGILGKLGIASLDQIKELIAPNPGFPVWGYVLIAAGVAVLIGVIATTSIIIVKKRKNNGKISKK